uniref:BolA-like protein 2 n=1 Tax=Ursus maritimus TaxID=29073 RepID=A0A452U2R4_URSMA
MRPRPNRLVSSRIPSPWFAPSPTREWSSHARLQAHSARLRPLCGGLSSSEPRLLLEALLQTEIQSFLPRPASAGPPGPAFFAAPVVLLDPTSRVDGEPHVDAPPVPRVQAVEQTPTGGLTEVEDTTPNRCASSFRVLVVSAKFEGKPLLQRHRLVNTCLAEELLHIHAFEQKTLTPEQWARERQK